MHNLLLWSALGLAMLNWLVSSLRIKLLEYITKPATIVLLLLWLWQTSRFEGALIWFAAALCFGLVGDILLMLPGNHFVAGLIAFLLGHAAYTAGLNTTPPPLNLPSLVITSLVITTGFAVFKRITASLDRKQQKYRQPLVAYTGILSIMLVSALLTLVRTEWAPLPALMVSFGAVLFFVSDILIAWDKFVAPFQWRYLFIRSTYHLGQFGLIIGAVLHFTAR